MERTKQEWLAEMCGTERDRALSDLRAFLVRGLGYALAPYSDVDKAAMEDLVRDALHQLIATELTDKHRQALAAVRTPGMPLEEVAHRMGTNRNALYGLMYPNCLAPCP